MISILVMILGLAGSPAYAVNCNKDPDLCDLRFERACDGEHYQIDISSDRNGISKTRVVRRDDRTVLYDGLSAFSPFEVKNGLLIEKPNIVLDRLYCE